MGNSVHASAGGLYGPSGARKYLTRDERERFLEVATAAPPLERTLCLTLAHSGCRISEALALVAGDVDAGLGGVILRSLKKRGRLVVRLVPAPPQYLALMEAVHGPPLAGRPLWPWHRTKAWQIIKGVMREAGVQGLHASPKGLRHAFGVNAILSGVPLPLVQKWLGHENPETTAIYTNVLGPEEREIAAWMWAKRPLRDPAPRERCSKRCRSASADPQRYRPFRSGRAG